MKTRIFGAAAAVAFAFVCGGAQATSVQFTVVSDTHPTITFIVPESPILDILHYDPGFGFEIDNVHVNANNVPAGFDDFLFFPASNFGGLNDTNYFNNFSPGISTADGLGGGFALYTGSEDAPTFVPGVYLGTYSDTEALISNATITIAETPLPAALPMFAGGLGALGLLGWRRKSKKAKAAH